MRFIKNTVYSIVFLIKWRIENLSFPLTKTKPLKRILLPIALFFGLTIYAQEDCLLGLGGMDDEAIISVFQLNEEQEEQMRNWSAELKVRNAVFKDRANYLLKRHAQSSPEDLISVSFKYKDLLDSMRQNVRMLDKRLLSIFNDNQYNLYIELCTQLTLRPIYINGSVNEN